MAVILLQSEEAKKPNIKAEGNVKTTNAFYLSDRRGLPLVISNPIAVSHNDLYNIGSLV